MFWDDEKKRRQAARWIIQVVAACLLIYLGISNINLVAGAIHWLGSLVWPVTLGAILALILNVPMRPIEKRLFPASKNPRLQRIRRPLAILLSFLLVLGIFCGVVLLVVPEFVSALMVLGRNVLNVIDQLAQLEETLDFSQIPFGDTLAGINIDWLGLKDSLEQWAKTSGGAVVDSTMSAIGSISSSVISFAVGVVFSVYILANKETLKRQVCRLIRAWLPQRFGDICIHVASVCSDTFRRFVAGQTTEAFILGSLCAIGMAILRLPYAPMIGALVGVTALIPVVGAFIGTIVGALMILTVDFFKAVIFVAFLLILQQIEGNLIYPRVVGSSIGLPGMWVLAAVTIGGGLAGPVGMLIGVPAASAAYALLREATEWREERRRKKETAPSQTEK